MVNRPIKFIVLTLLAISATAVLIALGSRAKTSQAPSHTPPIARANPVQDASVQSSDGKLTLTMKKEKAKDGTVYIFSISEPGGSQKELFRKTVPMGSSMLIPANTFSPDNKYVFLKQIDEGNLSYFVLSVSGTALAKDSQFLEFSSMFEAKYPDFKVTEATGWGGPNLIVINTDKRAGGQGPSFWFDLTSKSFIQLTNRFN